MPVSVFNLFSIGIGPSSSHTVGPMRAARQFILNLQQSDILSQVDTVVVDLYGSLALTGKGHSTDLAVLLGLEGEKPEEIDPNEVQQRIQKIRHEQKLFLGGDHFIAFKEGSNLLFHYDKQLPYHPNGMRFTSFNAQNISLLQ
jgi:L-serine dehydratase